LFDVQSSRRALYSQGNLSRLTETESLKSTPVSAESLKDTLSEMDNNEPPDASTTISAFSALLVTVHYTAIGD